MKLFNKIAILSLSFMVILASAGIMVSKHYCQGELKNFALFVKAKQCHDVRVHKTKTQCHPERNTCQKSEKKEGRKCCENKTVFLETDDFISTMASPKVNPEFQLIAVAFILYNDLLFSTEKRFVKFLNYKPPLIESDIPVLVQSFLL